jgi:hypothetical protein
MKCKQIKSNGKKCKSYAMISSDYCWVHSPVVPDEDKKAAFIKGGELRSIQINSNLPRIIINTSTDIPRLLIDTIERLREGTMHVRTGTAIGYLSYILLRSYEIADLEQRVKALEENVKDNQNNEYNDYEFKEYIFEDEKN